ncbi:MAG TPA: type II toxin-antitoxin system RelE/ParE family toxin [Edaphobacter sp.]|nr:type II toxin-antitoxin system RelE/ParE family toxin [Edaphobacter sp.]
MAEKGQGHYQLSVLAEADLAAILDYTIDTWGASQADKYFDLLIECFEQIAHMPSLGRRCSAVRPGVRRMETGKHVVFYRPIEDGVLIVRVLHQRELVTRKALMEGRT